jgi:CBS domain-containing protein
MKKSPRTKTASALVLDAQTAADLMTPDPMSLNGEATLNQAIAFLVERGFSAAPVIDAAGRPVGVLSQSDIVMHERQRARYVTPSSEYYQRGDLTVELGSSLPTAFDLESLAHTQVRDIMNAVVFAVNPQTPVAKVVEDMITHKIHRLFVIDADGVLIGVVSALDVLRHLRPAAKKPGALA